MSYSTVRGLGHQEFLRGFKERHSLALQMKRCGTFITAQEISALLAAVAAVMVGQLSRPSKMNSLLYAVSFQPILSLRRRN